MAQKQEFLDINTIRRHNLRLVVEQHGLAEVIERLGVHKNQMRHWIGRNPSRNVSDVVARKIERVFRLPKNYMDNDHGRTPSVIGALMEKKPDAFIEEMYRRAGRYETSQSDRFAQLEKRIAELERMLLDHRPIESKPREDQNATNGPLPSQEPNGPP